MVTKKFINSLSFILVLLVIFSSVQAAESKKTVSPGSDNAYKIGAGDVLKIITWKEEDFSLEENQILYYHNIIHTLEDRLLYRM